MELSTTMLLEPLEVKEFAILQGEYFCILYASSLVVLPNDLHLIGYRGHIDNFKVIRGKKIPIGMDFLLSQQHL